LFSKKEGKGARGNQKIPRIGPPWSKKNTEEVNRNSKEERYKKIKKALHQWREESASLKDLDREAERKH